MQADKNLKLHQMGKFQGKAQKRLGTKAQQRTGRQRGEHTALNTQGRTGYQDTGETNEGHSKKHGKRTTTGSLKQITQHTRKAPTK